MTARATFKQDDVSRAVKGVQAAGLPIARVVVVDGRIEVIVGDPQTALVPTANGWDDELHAS